MKEKKIEYISFIKIIMMLIIVLYHSMLFFNGNWFDTVTPIYNANYLMIIAKWLNTFHVQTFCMVSGFLYYYLKKEKGKYINTKKTIFNKFKKLIVPYIFTSIIWVIPISILFFHFTLKDIFFKFILMKSPGQLWFLITLFLIFVLYVYFLSKVKISTTHLLLIYFICTVFSGILIFFKINFFQIPNVVQYSLYFYFGGYLYKNGKKITQKQIIIIALITIALLIPYFYLDNLQNKIYFYFIKMILPIISLFEISIIYYLCSKKIINFNNKIYKLLENNSFGIYLFHQQIIYFTIILLNGVVHPIIQVLLSFIISLTISLIMSILLKKNKITKTMFGI